MTLTFELDLESVKVNQGASYLGQSPDIRTRRIKLKAISQCSRLREENFY